MRSGNAIAIAAASADAGYVLAVAGVSAWETLLSQERSRGSQSEQMPHAVANDERPARVRARSSCQAERRYACRALLAQSLPVANLLRLSHPEFFGQRSRTWARMSYIAKPQPSLAKGN